MQKITRKNWIKIILTTIIALVIIAIPLAIKFVGDHLNNPVDKDKIGEPIHVTFEVTCDNLFKESGELYIDNIRTTMGEELFGKLNEGNILSATKVNAKYGDSVMKITKEVFKAHSISISEYGGYIRAIAGLGEKMAGSNSGWVYTVNDKAVMTGASGYVPKNGDKIRWMYIVGDRN